MHMPKSNIAIFGAGLGGLTAALALARRGFQVQVYEQASALSEIGAGIHMSPNGNKVLNALGLHEGTECSIPPAYDSVIGHHVRDASQNGCRMDCGCEGRIPPRAAAQLFHDSAELQAD